MKHILAVPTLVQQQQKFLQNITDNTSNFSCSLLWCLTMVCLVCSLLPCTSLNATHYTTSVLTFFVLILVAREVADSRSMRLVMGGKEVCGSPRYMRPNTSLEKTSMASLTVRSNRSTQRILSTETIFKHVSGGRIIKHAHSCIDR